MKKRMNRFWVMMAALLLITPTYVLAQTHASKEFPNDIGGIDNVAAPGGTISYDILLTAPGSGSFPDVHTADVALAAGFSGDDVAYPSLDAICSDAVAKGYVCNGLGSSWTNPDPNFVGCGPNSNTTSLDCCSRDAAGTYELTCYHPLKGGDKGFRLAKKAVGFDVDAKGGGTKLNSVKHTTKAGNTVTTDLLPHWIVRVHRPSPVVEGTITLGVQPSGTQPVPVTTSGKTDVQLHEAIASSYNAAGLNCKVKTFRGPETSLLYSGPFVYCTNLQAVNLMTVKGEAGQEIHSETTSGIGYGNIPTLSEWGLILLAGILTVSALWMMRRRSQSGSPA